MVTYCATKLTATCSPMIGQFIYTMAMVIMIHLNLRLENWWKLFRTTLNSIFLLIKYTFFCNNEYMIHVGGCSLRASERAAKVVFIAVVANKKNNNLYYFFK